MRSNKRGKPMECVASPHFCNFSIGFNVLFLVVLRSSKVTILFLFIFILPFSILGPFLVRAVSKAFTLLPSAPLYESFCRSQRLCGSRGGKDLAHSSSHCSMPPLRAVHLPVRFRIWQFFRAAMTHSNSNCRWVVLWAQLPTHGQGQLQWGHSSNHPAVWILVHEHLWHRTAPSSKGKCCREWVSNPPKEIWDMNVTLQLLHYKMQ